MKHMIFVTAAAFALSLPMAVQAQSAEPGFGQLSLSQQTRLRLSAHLDSANERRQFLEHSEVNRRFSTKNTHNSRASAIFDRIRRESLEDE